MEGEHGRFGVTTDAKSSDPAGDGPKGCGVSIFAALSLRAGRAYVAAMALSADYRPRDADERETLNEVK